MTRTSLALLLRATLLAVPAEGAGDETAVAERVPASTYEDALARIEEGIALGDRQPQEAITILEPALVHLQRFAPELASDPQGLSLRSEAYVSLARAYQIVREEDKASAAIDEGLRSAPLGSSLPAKRYGPRVEKLWREREQLNREASQQEVEVECWMPCRVYLNERLYPTDEPGGERMAARVHIRGLTTGQYRLWVEAEDGSLEPLITVFEPGETGELLRFELGEPPPPKPIIDPDPDPFPKPDLDLRKRLLPRPVELSAIAAAVGLVATGVALVLIDGRCANPDQAGVLPSDGAELCPKLWATRNAGIALISSGAALGVAGSVLLGIDEVRGPRGGRAARVQMGWTMRF